jgi:hypothetical protein
MKTTKTNSRAWHLAHLRMLHTFLQKKLSLLILFFLPVFAINALPVQSFYVSPNQTVRNGGTVNMYCLERTKDIMRAANLVELSRISGTVRVLYNTGLVLTMDFNELINTKKIRIVPLNSYSNCALQFLDRNIVQISTGSEGIKLFRGEMTPHEEELARINIDKIKRLEEQGKPRYEIQEKLWDTNAYVIRYENGRIIYDSLKTEKEEEKVYIQFDDTATIKLVIDGKVVLQIDGLRGGTAGVREFIVELITHFHHDHISKAQVERALKEGSFRYIVSPNPVRNDSKNEIYKLLAEKPQEKAELEVNLYPSAQIISRKGDNVVLHETQIGNYTHSSFQVTKDIKVEMFKNNNPRNANDDGIIYQIRHKDVGYLFFGDADDPRSLEDLLDASAANEKQYYELQEEIYNLRHQEVIVSHNIAMLYLVNYNLSGNVKNSDGSVDPDAIQEEKKRLEPYVREYLEQIDEIEEAIYLLKDECSKLPFLRADIIKWMHHAHIDNSARFIAVIKKLNYVLDPTYFVYQHYGNQKTEEFIKFIEELHLKPKFLNSERPEIPEGSGIPKDTEISGIDFVSLLEYYFGSSYPNSEKSERKIA